MYVYIIDTHSNTLDHGKDMATLNEKMKLNLQRSFLWPTFKDHSWAFWSKGPAFSPSKSKK